MADLPIPASATPITTPVGLVGRGGAPLGDAGLRAAAAEALLAAADCVGVSDSDTLRQLVAAMDGVLAGGCWRRRWFASC